VFLAGDLVEIDCYYYKGVAIITGQTFSGSTNYWSFEPMDKCSVDPIDRYVPVRRIKRI